MKKIEALKLKNIVGGWINKVVTKDGKVVGYVIFDNETNTRLSFVAVDESDILEATPRMPFIRKLREEYARMDADYFDKEYHNAIKNLKEQGYFQNARNFF